MLRPIECLLVCVHRYVGIVVGPLMLLWCLSGMVMAYVISEGARRPEFFDNYYSSERRLAARQMVFKLREQIEERVTKKKMAPISAEQFFVTLSSSTLFPFAGGPMLTEVLGLSSNEFLTLIEQRRRDLPAFLKKALLR